MSIYDTVKLGRTPLRPDPRTIQYRAMASPWLPPPSFDFDAERGNVFPARMYLNDTYGDCVKVAQANHATRLEFDEQGAVINITDAEVKRQYFIETGGPDVGLDPITSLSVWRKGWPMAGKVYSIHSWAQVVPQDRQQTQEASIVGRGLQVALRLPISAAAQMDHGQPWDLVAGPDGEAGSWGGHMVYMKGYDSSYVYLWTWGKVQRATWRWLSAYSDFCAVAIDNVNRVGITERLDTAALVGALAEINAA